MKDITKLKEKVKKELGELNVDQLWAITLIAKHVRLRARNNTAFNNFMNNIFPHASFKEVMKTKTVNGIEQRYPGLRIEVNGVSSENDNENDD